MPECRQADVEDKTSILPVISARGHGHTFVWYGDCCSGLPDHPNSQNFAAVNAVFQRLARMPEYVVFAGDNIMGGDVGVDELRRQWRRWLDIEMDWFYQLDIPIYQIPSNHNTYNRVAETVFRDTFPEIPENGPSNQVGLSYWVRRDDLLIIFVNTNFSQLGGSGHVESEWLEQVLTDNRDATSKIVVGHHPIYPVNGYCLSPDWCVVPIEGEAFWSVLVKHGVAAYVCSHILAFDVQVHQGVLQVLTGGAGTYGMHLGLMPDGTEYFHLVQGAIDNASLRFQVIDTLGVVREWLEWPIPELGAHHWQSFSPKHPPRVPNHSDGVDDTPTNWVARFRVRANIARTGPYQTLFAGWQNWEGPYALCVGLTGESAQLVVDIVTEPGRGAQRWDGPEILTSETLECEIAIHSGMGPGGVLFRLPGRSWSSLSTTSNRGAELMAWPEIWAIGHGQSGPSDRPFQGSDLDVSVSVTLESSDTLFGATRSS